MNLLQDIQQTINGWQTDLKRIVLDIQKIYMEGPIIDGWLESYPDKEPAGAESPALSPTAILRHGDAEQIKQYVEGVYQGQTPTAPPPPSTTDKAVSPKTYRLCSMDPEGKVHCQVCPPEQIASVSLAIARNQRLRQLVNQKQYLEARLKRAVEVLSIARSELKNLSPNESAG